MIGQKFGKLTVVSLSPTWKKGKSKRYVCNCDCGTVGREVRGSSLVSGDTKSCGCRKLEQAKSGESRRTHGMTGSVIYNIWKKMKERCNNPKANRYAIYGERGITVCERWLVFENFYADMGDKPEGCSLDRIDNDGNYEPSNCRWATRVEQANNRSTNRIIEFNGEKKTVSQWAKEFDLPVSTIVYRLNSGWSIDKLLLTPVRYSVD